MARPKKQTRTYKLHSTTGLARCWVGGKSVTLGKYGSPVSRAEFARIIAELAVAPASAVAPTTNHESGPPAKLTTDELLLAFLKYARHHYRTPDGHPTEEVREIKPATLHLRRLYGHTPAREFGPKARVAVRQRMIDASRSRTLINRRIDRVKRTFKWAAAEELVPSSSYQALRTVPGLRRGRTAARESEPVGPVDDTTVDANLETWAEELARKVKRLERETSAVARLLDGRTERERAAKLLPTDGRDERIAKYERHLHGLLTSTLHELERLQARRDGASVPPPSVADLNIVLDGSG